MKIQPAHGNVDSSTDVVLQIDMPDSVTSEEPLNPHANAKRDALYGPIQFLWFPFKKLTLRTNRRDAKKLTASACKGLGYIGLRCATSTVCVFMPCRLARCL